MTEIDTSREAELHADFFDPSRGYCVLFSTYTALLDRAEKAEAEVERLRGRLHRIAQPGRTIAYCQDGHEEAVLIARAALKGTNDDH